MNIDTARKAAEFVRICETDEQGRMKIAVVPGHECKIYRTTFYRGQEQGPRIEADCFSFVDGEDCIGNNSGICYHVLAALIHAAEKQKLNLEFFESLAKKRYGEKVRLVSAQSGKHYWVIYQRRKK